MNEKNQPSRSIRQPTEATPAEKIALFRYGIIAPILHDSEKRQTRYFKQMSHKLFDVPCYGRKKYNWKTFKSWLRTYRRHGFEGLKPKTRADKGQSPESSMIT